MTTTFRTLVFSLILLQGWAWSAEPYTIAVLRFENNSLMNKETYNGLKKGLCDMLVSELSKISAFNVVERERLEAILMELELAQSDVVDPASAPRIGKLLGAQFLMFGSFIKDMGKKIRIDLRIVKVETGQIIKAVEATGKPKVLFKLVKKLSYKIADELDISITRAEKKIMKKTDKVSMEVLLVYSRGLEKLDAGDKKGALEFFKKAFKMDKSFTRAKSQIDKLK